MKLSTSWKSIEGILNRDANIGNELLDALDDANKGVDVNRRKVRCELLCSSNNFIRRLSEIVHNGLEIDLDMRDQPHLSAYIATGATDSICCKGKIC
jgi:hypothetical protein